MVRPNPPQQMPFPAIRQIDRYALVLQCLSHADLFVLPAQTMIKLDMTINSR
jgi:hypothetical protein